LKFKLETKLAIVKEKEKIKKKKNWPMGLSPTEPAQLASHQNPVPIRGEKNKIKKTVVFVLLGMADTAMAETRRRPSILTTAE
jgi:hypothetical protein